MRIIGLTGGIACGKSNVSAALASVGATIIDGDLLSREAVAPGSRGLEDIRAAFGDSVFHEDGTLNRRMLGDRVFQNPSEKAKLDGIMQPLIRSLTMARMEEAEHQGAKVCVLDMPLLYEFGYETLCDTVWCVYIPPEKQLQRLMERDHMTRQQALNRIASQMPAAEKAARAQTVIHTDGTLEETQSMVKQLYAREMAESLSWGRRMQ